MSGSIGFGGSAPVSLGDFAFQDFEIPETVKWGGAHMLKVHKFVGGARTIDAMGPDDADIPWSGVLLSSDASQRADILNQMRISGQAQPLVFLDRYYMVVIKSIELDQRRINYVPYRIVCTVLQDLSSVPPAPPPIPLVAVSDDIEAVYLIEPPPPLLPISAALAGSVATLANLTELDAGTAAAQSVSLALANATVAAQQADAVAEYALAEAAAAATASSVLGTAGSAEASATAINAAVSAALTAATAFQMEAYLGRAQINVGNL